MLREPSPAPEMPVPVAFASELSVEEQFCYVKPVLEAILTGRYEPAKHKHVGFMKGGKQCNAVTAAAWKRGEVSIEEKAKLSMCIRQWMHRRQGRQELGLLAPDPFGDADNRTDTKVRRKISIFFLTTLSRRHGHP